jgi:hypothetical protein
MGQADFGKTTYAVPHTGLDRGQWGNESMKGGEMYEMVINYQLTRGLVTEGSASGILDQ